MQLAVAITLGARNVLEAEQVQLQHRPLFGTAASDSTTHRALSALEGRTVQRIGQVLQPQILVM